MFIDDVKLDLKSLATYVPVLEKGSEEAVSTPELFRYVPPTSPSRELLIADYTYYHPVESADIFDSLFLPPEIEPGDHWLENAILLSPYWSTSQEVVDLTNFILNRAARVISISSRKRAYDALKAILLSLWVADKTGTPVRYSRDKNQYVRAARYGQLFFKYDRIKPLIDALEALGFIRQRMGFHDRTTGKGRLSRMWGTRMLWNRFKWFGIKDPKVVRPPEQEEIIVLRDKDDTEIGYRETSATRRMRDQLAEYNEFVKHHVITLDLPGDCEVDYEFLLTTLLPNIIHNRIDLLECRFRPAPLIASSQIPPVLSGLILPGQQPHYAPKDSLRILQFYYHYPQFPQPPPITHTNPSKAKLAEGLCEIRTAQVAFMDYLKNQMFALAAEEDALSEDEISTRRFRLIDIGVDRLLFRLNTEALHRIFNRSSFECGGRFYPSTTA